MEIGVLITYFNERDLLNQCLDSLFAQSKSPDEILIYDYASESSAENYVPTGYLVKIIRGAIKGKMQQTS